MLWRAFRIGSYVAVVGLLLAGSLWACPNCKEALAGDANAHNLVRGYYYSILFMMSMPFLILGGLSAYFYYEVRRARLRQPAAGTWAVQSGQPYGPTQLPPGSA